MKSMLMTSIPRYDLVAPPAAIGILQGVAKDNGIHAEVFDFNLFLKQNLTELEWQELDDWCIFVKHDICDALKSKIINLWDQQIQKRLPAGCEYLLMSVFSYWSLYIARLLLTHEGEKVRPYKLIVGGNGVSSKFPDTDIYFKDWNNQHKYIEHLILGEGEKPLAEILSNGKVSYNDGNIDSFPFPSYA